MKNRKLFAIITLVAFMLTMMPIMAFATSGTGSSISVEDGSAKADGTDKLEFLLDFDAALTSVADEDLKAEALAAKNAADKAVADIEADITKYNETADDDITYDNSGYDRVAKLTSEGEATGEAKTLIDNFNAANQTAKKADAANTAAQTAADAAGNQFVIVFAERNGSLSDVDTLSVDAKNSGLGAAIGKGVFYFNNINKAQEASLYVASETAGTVTLKAYVITGYNTSTPTSTDVANLYNGDSSFLKTGFVGNGVTGKFTTTNNTITADVTVTDEDGANVAANAKGEYTGARANNGVDYYKVSMKFEKGGSKLVGEDVTLSVDRNGATLNKDEVTTSATGKIEFKVSASKEGTYKVSVDCGSYSDEFEFVFTAAQIDKVEITNVTSGTIAVDETETVAIQVVAYDSNGNVVPADTAINQLGNFKAEVVSAPEDSSLEDNEVEGGFVYDPNTCDNIYLSFTPDAEGAFEVKIYNENTGVADYATINAAEFGTIDHATISYPASTYALGERTQAATVYVYDQNGVKKTVKSNKTFSYSGVGVAAFNSSNGQVTFKNDNDYVGNEIVVSVVANNKYSATTTIKIASEAAALSFTDATGQVGEDVTVNAQVVDLDGNSTAITSSGKYSVKVQSAIITEKPEGAAASVDADYFETSANTFLKKGTGKVTITSNKEGTVKANIVLALTNEENVTIDGKDYAKGEYTFYLSGVATANFGEGAGDVTGADDIVTFIIGSQTFIANDKAITSDVAPYIVDGRTFIPVRAFVEATGASVEYDAATQVVTIAGEGIDAQMTIGSNILTVNGETVVMDTAAAIKDGRTVLPVRYAGQAIGYDFECAYGADGAVTSVTMFK